MFTKTPFPDAGGFALNDETASACLIHTTPHGKAKLFVQVLDAYGYQRELTISHVGGAFELHAYRHPGRRFQSQIPEKLATKLISRFLDLAQRFPSLLWNHAGNMPRNSGFVHLHERMLDGATRWEDFIELH